ncbi:hypothetical protein SEVIR_3G246351v4 [Setaria viridis]
MAGAARASSSLLDHATLVLLIALVAAHVPLPVRAQDTVTAGRPLSGDAKLVSRGGKFAMGFFQPDGGVSGRWYVGIWYNNIAVRTPVWVANRDRPVSDPAASRLAIAPDGNLALLDPSGSPVWSTTATGNASNATVAAVLLDTGNLVLAPASNASDVLWQSFDHIGDTWLPGGKLRRDKATGAIQGMTSWRARGDPAPGMYTLQLDPAGAPQYVLLWNGTRKYWLTGDWNGRFFTGAPEVAASGGDSGYSFRFVDNDRESYFTYSFADNSTVYRFVTDVSGQVKGWFWVEAFQRWNLVYAEPKARCAVPRGCGAFGVCSDAAAACACARGFTPRDAVSWSLGDTTGGCVRNTELQCGNNGSAAAAAAGSGTKVDRFFRMDGMRLPEDGRVTGAASSDECESACVGNCACSAYAYNGSCVLWNGELQNLEEGYGNQLAGAGSLYLRLAASEFPMARSHKRRTVEIAVGATAIVCFVRVHHRRPYSNGTANKKDPRPHHHHRRGTRDQVRVQGPPGPDQELFGQARRRLLRLRVPRPAPQRRRRRRCQEAGGSPARREAVPRGGEHAGHHPARQPDPPAGLLLRGRRPEAARLRVHAQRLAGPATVRRHAPHAQLARAAPHRRRRREGARLPARRVPGPHHPLRRQAGEHPPGRGLRAQGGGLRARQARRQRLQPGADHHARHRRVPRAGVDRRRGDHRQGRRVQLRHDAVRDRVREEERRAREV